MKPEIFRWDGSFPVIPTLSSAGLSGLLPELSDSNLVWVDYGPAVVVGSEPSDRWSRDVFFSDGVITTKISESSPSVRLRNYRPDISGERVVWESCAYGYIMDLGIDTCLGGSQIYMATVPVPTAVPSVSFPGLAILTGLLIGTFVLLTARGPLNTGHRSGGSESARRPLSVMPPTDPSSHRGAPVPPLFNLYRTWPRVHHGPLEFLSADLGVDAANDAAGVIATFNMVTRMADAAGIPVDAGFEKFMGSTVEDAGIAHLRHD